MQQRPLVVLTGPTAVGKTELSIRLAEQINGAVISADSMQVYQSMDIGSAKITKKQMRGIPHYLIDELKPWEEFNAALFREYAKKYIEKIYADGRIPIITGGTGFYIQALLYDIDFTKQDAGGDLRIRLEAIAEKKGAAYLHRMLAKADPASADAIHENNVRRTIRALEFYFLTGTKISAHNETERQKQSPYCFAYFVLNDKRERIYEQIEKRVDDMLAKGLVDEVRRLKEMGCTKEMTSMQGLGYKELFPYLEGICALEDAVYVIKRDTRHFAKRQLTWFRREKDVIWVNKDFFSYDNDKILAYMCDILTQKGITDSK